MDTSGQESFTKRSVPTQRSCLRHVILCHADLKSSAAGRLKVRLLDISERGCKCERTTSLIVGSYISVVLPGMGPIGSRVAWIDRHAVGLEFSAPLHSAVLTKIVRSTSVER